MSEIGESGDELRCLWYGGSLATGAKLAVDVPEDGSEPLWILTGSERLKRLCVQIENRGFVDLALRRQLFLVAIGLGEHRFPTLSEQLAMSLQNLLSRPGPLRCGAPMRW